jgi:hypothetical protein
MKKQNNRITWSSKRVPTAEIAPTEKNYKIKTDIGRERLQKSLQLFGLAGNVIVNPITGGGKKGKKFMLIDGNSRLEEAVEGKEKMLWVSFPSRPLTPKEFQEMAAMYDFAKAGEVDIDRIQGDLGKTKEFFDKWNMDVPMALLDKLGSKADAEDINYPSKKSKKGKDNGGGDVNAVNNVCMVNLFFDLKQEAEFRKMEEKLMAKYKVDSTSDMVLKAYRLLTKK